MTLLPKYVDVLQASDLMAGLFLTAFTLLQTLAVVPLAWADDRYDKRLVLLCCLGRGIGVYAGFTLVGSSLDLLVPPGPGHRRYRYGTDESVTRRGVGHG